MLRRESATSGWIDTHVHVFPSHAPLAEDRRYAPDYEASPEALLAEMQGSAIGHALLVQPSFLGTDNSFLLACIAARPAHFAGIAVVEEATGRDQLRGLRAAGIVGLRLNCIGKPVPDFAGTHGALARHLGELDMVLQIQAEEEQWQAMEAFLADPPGRVVIDHFGRARPGKALAGLARAARRTPRLWFKFSAPYRLPGGSAAECAATLLDAVGPGRIVWGSDWPATQFEDRHFYADTLRWLAEWLPDPAHREAVLATNPRRLYRLDWA